MKRRTFLAAGAVLAVPALIPNHVLGKPGRPGANDRVRVGLIGLGGRCKWLYNNSYQQIQGADLAGVCDLFQPRLDQFMSKARKDDHFRPYDDFRKMIETEKLDGVMVETMTHARAWVALEAMKMGTHVYLEKPMCLTISEGRTLVNAARHYKKVTQVGTQQRSIPLNKWASKLIREGVIGKVKYVLAPNFVGPLKWETKPGQPLPAGGKDGWWDQWTNQAEYRDYHPQIHYGWSQWWDYDAGGVCFGVAGWGAHSYDQVNCGLGTDQTGPVAVLLEEPCTIQDSGKFPNRSVEDDETGAGYYKMAKVKGPRARVKMLFENGTELRLHLDGDRGPGLGAIFVGEKGKIEINRNKISANPKELIIREDNPGPNKREESVDHVENWLDCIRTGEKCVADVEVGQRGATLCDLVNITRAVGKVGETLLWDPVNERFKNCEEANKYLSRPRRKGYELVIN